MDGFVGDPNRGRTDLGDLDPNKIAHELTEWGRQFAEAKATYTLLRKQEPVVLSELIIGLRKENPKLSRADAKDLALTSDTYADHLNAQVEAEREKNVADASYKAAIARWEAMRTAEATRRAEMLSFRGAR